MTSQVTTVTPDMDVEEVTKLMANQQIRRVPVVENNQLVGMLSLGDIAADTRFEMEASEALCEISNLRNLPECNICSIKGIRYFEMTQSGVISIFVLQV